MEKLSDWGYHIEQVRNDEDLTGEQREEVMESIFKIKEVFGEDWLKKAVETRHPLFEMYFINMAPWTRFWLLDFGKKLKDIENIPNSNELVNRLKGADSYSASVAELEVLSKLKRAGIDVELYPKVVSGVPDLKAVVDGVEIFIEVTEMGASEESMEAGRTHRLVHLVAFNLDIESSCKIYKPLSVPHIGDLRAKIQKAIEEVKKKNCCREISEPGVIDCFICPKGKSDELERLLKERGLKRTLEGPPYSTDELRRIKKKIQDKVKQLPKDKPGIIVIFDPNIWVINKEDYYEIAYELEEAIYGERRLMLGIIWGGVDSRFGEFFVEKEDWVIVQKILYGVLPENRIIIKNKYCKFPINEKILKAFS